MEEKTRSSNIQAFNRSECLDHVDRNLEENKIMKVREKKV